ncbi:unnamed protein product, partial [Rhizoctonia solani]
MNSLEWLVCNVEPGDNRYFHFSGYGQAYEVAFAEGKVTRARPVPQAASETAQPLIWDEQADSSPGLLPPQNQNDSPPHSVILQSSSGAKPTGPIAHYREALLTHWRTPSWAETRPLSTGHDAYNRIDDEVYSSPHICVTINSQTTQELNTVLAKLPKGCTLTMTLEVTMECVQGPDTLHDIKATVFAWSGFSTQPAHAGAFISAFTSAAEGLNGNLSHHEMLQDI